MAAERYPLSWPMGWKRTAYGQRRRAAFYSAKRQHGADGQTWLRKESLSVGQALERLNGELRRLAARRIVISSNLRLREDGQPYASQAKQLDDPGVAVYFHLNNLPIVLACDRWSSAAENIAAIAGHIAAMRAQDRYGVGSLDQAFTGYKALPAPKSNWRSALGFGPDEQPTAEQINVAFRSRARAAHPDAPGGSHEAFVALEAASQDALAEIASS